MKAKIIIILNGLLSLIILLNSCNTKERTAIIRKLPRETKLTGKFVGPKDQLLFANKVGLYDSLLIVIDIKNENNDFIQFYRSNDYTFLGSFGRKGRGPNEFQSVEFLNQYQKGGMWILDPVMRSFKLYSVKSMLDSISPEPEITYDIPGSLGIVTGMYFISDSILMGISRNGMGRLFIWNPKNNRIHYVENFPKLSHLPKNQNILNATLYYSYLGIKPDNSGIISAMDMFKRIDCFDSYGNIDLSIEFSNRKKNTPKLYEYPDKFFDENTYQYLSVFVTKNHIYALYYGDKIKKGEWELASVIHVFDMKGNLESIYKLTVPIINFAVDEKNKVIIGLSPFNVQPIVQFNISDQRPVNCSGVKQD